MRITLRLIVALAASLLLAVAVGSSSARNLSISNQAIRLTFSSIEFNANEFAVVRCPVTLEGSFHTRTIAKVVRSLVGSTTRAVMKQETCTNGIGAFMNGTDRYNGGTPTSTLPWHLTYESFQGTLPNITAAQLLVSGFRLGLRDSSSTCTAQYGRPEDNITAQATREAGGGITGIAPVAGRNTTNLFRRDGGLFCPPEGTIIGTGSVMLLGTTNRISITLI